MRKIIFNLFFMALSSLLILGCNAEGFKGFYGSAENSKNNSGGVKVTNSQNETVKLSGKTYRKTDYLGNIKLFGEVENIGDGVGVFIKAQCTFYNLDSSEIDSDSTYIIGSVVTLNTGSNTNTALSPNETGFFEISTDIATGNVDKFDCHYTYDTNTITIPYEKLEISGEVIIKQSSYSDKVEFNGSVINSGTKELSFGQVYFVIKNISGEIIGISSSYIDGETVYLLPIGSTTDTALSAGKKGVFSVSTSVRFNEFSSYILRTDWSSSK